MTSLFETAAAAIPRPVRDWAQYVGKTDYYMVFILVSNRYLPNKPGEESTILAPEEQIITPILPDKFQEWVNHTAVCHRYEVQIMDEAFIADESHRDSYPFHIPGFHRIKQLEVGSIFPLEGFRRDEFLSDTDRALLSSKLKVANLVHDFYRKESEKEK